MGAPSDYQKTQATEVVRRQHPSMYHDLLNGLVHQESEDWCVMGQMPMLLALSAAISQLPGLKMAKQRFLYPHSTRHGPSWASWAS